MFLGYFRIIGILIATMVNGFGKDNGNNVVCFIRCLFG